MDGRRADRQSRIEGLKSQACHARHNRLGSGAARTMGSPVQSFSVCMALNWRTTVAEQASSFMRDWIAANIRSDPVQQERDLAEWAADEIGRLKDAARAEGLDLNDPELEESLLRDEITAAIKRVTS